MQALPAGLRKEPLGQTQLRESPLKVKVGAHCWHCGAFGQLIQFNMVLHIVVAISNVALPSSESSKYIA